jgi:phage terminase large subunit-like protein
MVGHFPQLEDQLKDFDAEKYTGPGSPDRAESFIWGMTELFGLKGGRGRKRRPEKFKTYKK